MVVSTSSGHQAPLPSSTATSYSASSTSMASIQQQILSSLMLAEQGALLLEKLQQDLSLDRRVVADALRGLMESGKVQLHRSSGDGNAYVALINSIPEGPSLVLDAIRASGNSGIDQAALCAKIRLPKSEVIKSIQMLLAQKRIKERRCFSNRAKRIYLLFEFEPSDEVTGGTFYGGEDSREMDVWFVDEMRRLILAFVAQRRSVSLEEITRYLCEPTSALASDTAPSDSSIVVVTVSTDGSSATSVGGNNRGTAKRISPRDAQLLVQTLVLDGILDCVTLSDTAPAQYQLAFGRNAMRHFTAVSAGSGVGTASDGAGRVPAHISRASAWAMPAVGLPCVGCPQLQVCSATGTGVINPRNCAYLNEWLN
ncbi:putative RNA polymerase Rpc34 subunit [Trypanosoma vivax]|uniref:DNA-directed RNA polymerase III subunit RPC6 n=1 Tax=Trypanosoma vivax (strain Y486) TaxID=1055687 RepID=G0TT62_TRYVY|nr:hypothetical protein TRVL_05450 [Trypanosoma vivax]KAH8619632.1 putative RNA polymerase Rpc34 subunit [Trypanosoma vivax]CCC47143.1 conserved hypothetical protein [Trypanosoma vivax Y486]